MTLQVYSARLGCKDPDYLDVSLQGNMRVCEQNGIAGGHRGMGLFFAPSPDLLYPYLSKKRFGRLTERDWVEYRARYIDEMRGTYRRARAAWDRLLSWDRVVILCFCTDDRCHRTILRAEILPKLGAVDCGELAAVARGAA